MVEFSEKTRSLSVHKRAAIAQLVVNMYPNPRSPRTKQQRVIKAAVLMFLAEHSGAPTAQLVVHLYGSIKDEKEYARQVANMTGMLQTLSGLGLVVSDKEPRFVPRAHFGPNWYGGAKPGVTVPDHTARWEVGAPIKAVLGAPVEAAAEEIA